MINEVVTPSTSLPGADAETERLVLASAQTGNIQEVFRHLGTKWSRGYLGFWRIPVARGVPVNHKFAQEKGRSLLHVAVSKGNLELTRALLAIQDVDVNALDNDLNTSVHLACNMGSTLVLSLLVAHPQVLLNVKNRLGQTPLWCAVSGCYQTTAYMVLMAHAELALDARGLSTENQQSYTAHELARHKRLIDLENSIKARTEDDVHFRATVKLALPDAGQLIPAGPMIPISNDKPENSLSNLFCF